MTGVSSEPARREPGSDPECQPGVPDARPGAAAQEGTSALATLAIWDPGHAVEGPECPQCGATMSRFPLVVYCGYCEFYVEAPGRRPQESMLPLRTPEGVPLA